jgi:hypothetical protein
LISICSLSFLLMLGFSTTANAVVYGDFMGTSVEFIGVQDQNGLFGAPFVSGDSLDFSPNAFEADCSLDPACPPTPTTVDDTLTITIQANGGSFIDDVLLTEAGDTTLQSFTGAFAATVVTATVFVDIFQINGVNVNNINGNAVMVFTQNGQYESDDEGYGTHIWTGSLLIDIDQIIADAGATGQATRIQLNLDNTLTAFGASGATARIEKKDIDGLAITVVPEPGTALLLGLGLVALRTTRPSRYAVNNI